jgi:hypothetical protein
VSVSEITTVPAVVVVERDVTVAVVVVEDCVPVVRTAVSTVVSDTVLVVERVV